METGKVSHTICHVKHRHKHEAPKNIYKLTEHSVHNLLPAWLEVKGVSGCCCCPIFPLGRKEPLQPPDQPHTHTHTR